MPGLILDAGEIRDQPQQRKTPALRSLLSSGGDWQQTKQTFFLVGAEGEDRVGKGGRAFLRFGGGWAVYTL